MNIKTLDPKSMTREKKKQKKTKWHKRNQKNNTKPKQKSIYQIVTKDTNEEDLIKNNTNNKDIDIQTNARVSWE